MPAAGRRPARPRRRDARPPRRLPRRRPRAAASRARACCCRRAAARRTIRRRDPRRLHLLEEGRQRRRPQPRQAPAARRRPRRPARARPPRLGLRADRPPRGHRPRPFASLCDDLALALARDPRPQRRHEQGPAWHAHGWRMKLTVRVATNLLQLFVHEPYDKLGLGVVASLRSDWESCAIPGLLGYTRRGIGSRRKFRGEGCRRSTACSASGRS